MYLRVGLYFCLAMTPSGVISQNIKFCEVFAYDAPFLKSQLDVIQVPVIHLERDFTENIDQQISTRLEAFVELLEQNQ